MNVFNDKEFYNATTYLIQGKRISIATRLLASFLCFCSNSDLIGYEFKINVIYKPGVVRIIPA